MKRLEYTEVKSWGSPIKTTGHPYNSAALPHSRWQCKPRSI